MKRSLLSAFLIGSLVFLFACSDSSSPTSAMENSVDGKVMNDKTPPPESGVVMRGEDLVGVAIFDFDRGYSLVVGYNPYMACTTGEADFASAPIMFVDVDDVEVGVDETGEPITVDRLLAKLKGEDLPAFVLDAVPDLPTYPGWYCQFIVDNFEQYLYARGPVDMVYTDNDYFGVGNQNTNSWGFRFHGVLTNRDGDLVRLNAHRSNHWNERQQRFKRNTVINIQ